ncbi:phosphotransferase family protein [Pseudonocardia xishanensis]|uniref:Aminoglycoside phosphotransferase domain-containing protein n=1 Tax=Pseudonocardia xishanensis TaxID=630995 RepID=A0ABP8RQB8_9PSEU
MHTLDAASIGEHLSRTTGEQVDVVSARRTFPGISRETWLVETSTPDVGFVVRVAQPWDVPTPSTIEQEFAVYDALWRAGVPVAEPLWHARDLDFADGRPHMVRRLVPGSSKIPGLREDTAEGEALRRRVVHSHLDALATLHRFDWRAAGLDAHLAAPAGPADALRAEVDRWEARWRAGRPEPRPVVTEYLCWLREHIPTDVPMVSLVKGNNGVGEEIFRDGRVVALSDFELSELSDPALDLAFTQGTLSLIDQREAIDHYAERVGHKVTPHRMAFAMLWNRFKALACLDLYFLAPFLAGADPRSTSGAFGLVTVPRMERSLARLIGADFDSVAEHIVDAGAGTYA